MNFVLPMYVFGLALLTAATASAADATPQYTIQTVAGGTYAGDDGPAVSAILAQPEGLARDREGNLYIADAGDHRVRKVTRDGVIHTIAGTGDRGNAGDGGLATAAQLNAPYGIAFDADGNLYVADLGNARVRRVDAKGVITTFAGGGTTTPSTSAIAASDARLIAPRNVAVDGAGNVFISDFGAHCVYEVDRAGRLTVVAGTGEEGFSGDGGPATQARLSAPAGLVVDAAGVLYIADSGNRRVRRLIAGSLWTLATDPRLAGQLMNMPTGLALDAAGDLYVGNYGSGHVLRITHAGTMDEIPIQAQDLVAADGALVVSSGRSVVRYTLSDSATAIVAGGSDARYSGDDGPATAARLWGPYAVAEGLAGDVYIADMLNARVRRVDAHGVITTASNLSTIMVQPAGVALDSRGRLFVADRGSHRILMMDETGNATAFAGTGAQGYDGETSAAATRFDSPHALAFDKAGNLYVADTGNARIRRITPSGYVTTFAGGGTYTGDDAVDALSARFTEPRGLAFDRDGNLWVADMGSGRIRKISPGGKMTSPFTMTFEAPRAISFGPDGVMFIAETGANRVSSVTPDGVYAVVAGTGDKGFSGDGGAAAAAFLSEPTDVAALADGSVLVADLGNNRVRKLSRVVPPAPVEAAPVVVLHAATNARQAVVPGQIVSIYGRDLGSDATVTFDGVPARVFYGSRSQINAQVPPELKAGTTAAVRVESKDAAPGTATVQLTANAPGLFVAEPGRAAALNQDGSVNSPVHPVARGSIVCLFGTGLGTGVQDVRVMIGMYAAEVLYAGPAPGLAGVFQVNARVPSGFVPAGDLEVRVTAGGVESPSGVTITAK